MKTLRFLPIIALLSMMFAVVGGVGAQGGELTPGTPVEGTLAGDPDVYTISLTEGQLVLFSMVSEEFDTRVTLKNSSGTEVGTDDDGGVDNNALLAFVAQADDTYSLEAGAFFSGEGAYTLTATLVEATEVTAGSPVTLSAVGELQVYAVYRGTAGEVVDIRATSAGDDDVDVAFNGVNEGEVDSDDDDGPGNNSLLRRVVLPADGLYLIKSTSLFDEAFAADVEIAVDSTEQLIVADTPIDFALSDDALGTEVFTFEATAGTTYRITATSVNGTGIRMQLLDTDAFFTPDIESGDAVRVSWDYRATAGGTFRIDVHPSFFSDGDSYQIWLEVVE
jgi:hypothetical protein